MEKLAIPAYPPELLEKKGARNSLAMIDFRGYTVESFLRAYRDCGPIFKTKVNGLDEVVFGGLKANEEAWCRPDEWSYGKAVKVFREELSSLHLTQLDREPHRRKRRLLNKAFKSSSIMASLPQIAEQIRLGLKKINGVEVELHEALMEVYTKAQSVSSIKETLSDAIVEIQDLAGDGNHYSATVTSSQFSGKSKIEQHKMVYNSLKGKMGNELHALAIKTKEQ